MIVLLATNQEQGRFYMRQMFPLESPKGSRAVRIVSQPQQVMGLGACDFIKVGQFPHTDKDFEVLDEAKAVAARYHDSSIIRGPER